MALKKLFIKTKTFKEKHDTKKENLKAAQPRGVKLIVDFHGRSLPFYALAMSSIVPSKVLIYDRGKQKVAVGQDRDQSWKWERNDPMRWRVRLNHTITFSRVPPPYLTVNLVFGFSVRETLPSLSQTNY